MKVWVYKGDTLADDAPVEEVAEEKRPRRTHVRVAIAVRVRKR